MRKSPLRKRVRRTAYKGILSTMGIKYTNTLECGHVWYSSDSFAEMRCYECWPGIPNTASNVSPRAG